MRNRTELLDGAESDPVSLAQGSVYGSRFGNAQFSPVNHEGNVGGIGVAITNETFGTAGLIDDRPKNPTVSHGIR